jgi:hypothetical protein
MQSRWNALLEAAANVVAGLVLSFLLQLALFRIMDITASIGQNLLLTIAFSILSLFRSYVLRRMFDRCGKGHRRVQKDSPMETQP